MSVIVSACNDRSFLSRESRKGILGSIAANALPSLTISRQNAALPPSEDLLALLSKQRTDCAEREDFVGAAQATSRIVEAHEWMAQSELARMEDVYEKQLLALSRAHERELEAFKHARTSAMLDEKLRASRLMRELADKHENELAIKREQLTGKSSQSLHFSKEILHLRQSAKKLASEGMFSAAHQTSEKVASLEEKERKIHLKRLDLKTHQVIERLVAKQRYEQQELNDRLSMDAEKVELSIESDFKRIVQRFKNIINEVKTQHEIAITAVERKHRNKAICFHEIRLNALGRY